jgi:hypothetical protein
LADIGDQHFDGIELADDGRKTRSLSVEKGEFWLKGKQDIWLFYGIIQVSLPLAPFQPHIPAIQTLPEKNHQHRNGF